MAALLIAVPSGSLHALGEAPELARQWARCRGHEIGGQISACTAVIRSGRETPGNLARAFFNRGRALSDRGDYDRAIPDFGQAIRLDPDYPDAFNGRGIARGAQGQNEMAIADFDQAIRLDPNFAIAIYNRALVLQTMGRTAEAEREFERARQAGPRLTEAKE